MAQTRNITTESLREYYQSLFKRIYTNPELIDSDARTLAAMSRILDAFLRDYGKVKDVSDNLVDELQKLAEEYSMGTACDQHSSEDLFGQKKMVTEDGKYLYLGNIIGRGGEGTVYKVPSMPGKVAKIYNNKVDVAHKKKNIQAFIHNKIPSKIDNILIATVPEKELYTLQGKFAGYLMTKAPGAFHIYDVMRSTLNRTEYFPTLDYRGMIVIAYNLAEVVNYMHQHKVVIGDLNFNNIIVNTDGTVCLIDADSFQITDSDTGEKFPCCVGVRELLAPELQKVGSLEGKFTKETDIFSLAIIIFRLLMNNADPFGFTSVDLQSSTDLGDEQLEILNGECVYVKEVPGKNIPEWAPDFNMLPSYVRDLFKRAFSYTKDDYLEKISQRPTAKEWMDALLDFSQESFQQCNKEPFHWYPSGWDHCPFCRD